MDVSGRSHTSQCVELAPGLSMGCCRMAKRTATPLKCNNAQYAQHLPPVKHAHLVPFRYWLTGPQRPFGQPCSGLLLVVLGLVVMARRYWRIELRRAQVTAQRFEQLDQLIGQSVGRWHRYN